jgi:SAM-dependent methyltransferase
MNVGRLTRRAAYGQSGLSWADRLGVYLSKQMILRHLPKGASLAALDIGCGYYATLLQAISSRSTSGLGIDVQIDERVKGIPGLSFIEGEIERVLPSLDSERFHIILLISVLEHLWEPLWVVKECYRLLKPGGVLFINVPTWRGKRLLEFSAFRLGSSPACEMNDHKMYYDLRDLWPILVKAGFLPSCLDLKYHKLGLNLFAVARKQVVLQE